MAENMSTSSIWKYEDPLFYLLNFVLGWPKSKVKSGRVPSSISFFCNSNCNSPSFSEFFFKNSVHFSRLDHGLLYDAGIFEET